jgi:hypothetical protein
VDTEPPPDTTRDPLFAFLESDVETPPEDDPRDTEIDLTAHPIFI